MSDLLKGNFAPKRPVKGEKRRETAEETFEREALRNLGGSIAFVSKKKFVWTGEDTGKTSSADD